MTPELDALLCEKYPKIFKDRYAPVTQTAMCWGFDCGDGWFHILDALCGSIQWYVDSVTRYTKDGPVKCQQVVASQVKEKFGGLRFYYGGGDDSVQGMVWMAEHMARHTCEECGKEGKLRDGVWLSTLCNEHAEEKS